MTKRIIIKCLLLLLVVSSLTGCIFKTEDALVVGSRNNTESIILSNVMGQLIEEKTGINVTYKENLGGSNVVWEAMING